MKSQLQAMQSLVEPVSRVVRRGKSIEIRNLTKRLHEAFEKAYPDGNPVAAGMFDALGGVLEFAQSRAERDGVLEFIGARRHALPLLHALAMSGRNGGNAKLALGQLAEVIGVRPQNLGALVQELVERDVLSKVPGENNKRLVSLAPAGLEALSLMLPGWQGRSIEQSSQVQEWNEALKARTRTVMQRERGRNTNPQRQLVHPYFYPSVRPYHPLRKSVLVKTNSQPLGNVL